MTNSRQSRRRTLVLYAIIMLGGFVFWIVGLAISWPILRDVGAATDFWSMAQTLTGMVTMLAILSGSLVGLRQLTEASHSRHLAVADRLFEELNSPENIEARRWVFRSLPGEPEEGSRTLSPEGQAAIKRVLNSLDHVAFLTQSGWIPEETIMPWMNPMVVKAWAKLERYVEYESRKRGEPDYYQHARELANRCREWRTRHLPNAKTIWVDDAL